ncbi:comF operon protein 3 [Alkalihalophilus pseudofirmus OF4]|uniref:ComF operon protein 3 n=1 Tax=Alkalihalophilus pseudofirmus (strain ATCC BAA-2126 / JCM 17055 / OF4) TaxID=398511 RepID=D3FZF5_ALKPO|nr:phosphoribosyltransferase family protein [Alkalihalophilus pseudofirmus]ADC49197.1 comF operon protein 3 [Alkalihalophilus pseudofirmus OF4]
MRCLICHEKTQAKLSWSTIFLGSEEELVCERCEEGLEMLGGEQCELCSRVLGGMWRSSAESLCLDCTKWNQHETAQDLLVKNTSLYAYNETMKEWLAQYKYQGDAEVSRYFSTKLKSFYAKNFRDYSPVLMPLSNERLHARGFNQVELITKEWLAPTVTLGRRESEQQSKKNRKARVSQLNQSPFYIQSGIDSVKTLKKIVLVDDVYTTGTTVRQAAYVLRKHGAEHIESLTLAR